MKIKYYSIIFFSIVVICVSSWEIYSHKNEIKKEPIHIAVVAPFSTTHYSDTGKSFEQGIRLLLQKVNKRGGVNGHKILLDIYDDQDDPKRAYMQALAIAKESRAVGVIGHSNSSTSIEGGKVYKEYKIPAITPTSTNDKVTLDNPWYFRTIFNDSFQGRFLANYSKHILNQNTVSIIYESSGYGRHLAEVFEKTAQELEMTTPYKWQLDAEIEDTKERQSKIIEIVKDVYKNRKKAGMIFLASRRQAGIDFIKLIKDIGIDNPIFVSDSLSFKLFTKEFEKFPKEQQHPGFYTEGIYVATPLIFDTAPKRLHQFRTTYQEEYGVDPDWHAAFAYDAAKMLIEGIKSMDIQGEKAHESLESDREKIRTYLASLNSSVNAVEGTTGMIYFNESRDSNKLPQIGIYKNNEIISAPIQLQRVENLKYIPNLKELQEKQRILSVDEGFMYKTNVVYTGIEMKKINEIDIEKSTHDLEFYLWFRYKDGQNIHPQHIKFLNAVEPIILCNPDEENHKEIQKIQENAAQEKSATQKDIVNNENTPKGTTIDLSSKINPNAESISCIPILEEKKANGFIYRQYLVKGQFNIDFMPNHYFGQHLFGFNFHHIDFTQNYLIYVIDILGMNLKSESALENFEKEQILKSTDWRANEVLFFQDVMGKKSLGDPDYLSMERDVEFSRYNLRIRVQGQNFTLRGIISEDDASFLLKATITFLILSFLIGKMAGLGKWLWFLEVFAVFTLLSSLEVLLLNWQSDRDEYDLYTLSLIVKGFDILWWVTFAVLLNTAVKLFLWTPLEKKTGRAVPQLARRFLSFLIHLIGIFCIVAFVFDQEVTSLLATSGVVAMIIGLAIQVNISNIFSGLAINIERPFRVGDWVKIGDFEVGKVLDVTWRSTHIETMDSCILSIPNSVASESVIHNYCYPENILESSIEVSVSSEYPPERVEKILTDAILSANGILKRPEPSAELKEIQQWSAVYTVSYFVSSFEDADNLYSAVWKHVWTHLHNAGILPATPRQNVHISKKIEEEKEIISKSCNSLIILNEFPIFRFLPEEEKIVLAQKMRKHQFTAGNIIRKGNLNNALFIIAEGVLGLWIESEEGELSEVMRLDVGDFFDETELHIGKDNVAIVTSITDSQLFEISKEDITPLMEKHPDMLKEMKIFLAKRHLEIMYHFDDL